LLWEITGNGLSKPSYLYGTMHVSKKVAFHLTDAFFEGLKNTDVVALETNPETWLAEIMEEGMSMLNSNYFRNYYGGNSNFYQKAFSFSIPGNKFIQAQIAKEPENVNSLLYRYNGYSGNFEEYTYLDLFIFQSARKSNKPVIALEDFKTSLAMLAKASMPDEDKDAHLSRRAMPPYNIGEKVEDAYRKGDLDALDSLNRLSYQTKNFEKYMLTDRNIIMVHNMDSIMKKKSLFTAVGAAHLPGDNGVISLLKKMGYTVKPVMSSVSKKSIKVMNSFEELHTPLVFQTQFSSDSSFKVDAPGKLFEVNGIDQMDSYLYTDMVNGSYYMVRRIRNYGLLLDCDEAYQSRRIDSMLYESIPGKIIRKEQIKANNGDPGFEIVNKTRRGDLQHYRIYVNSRYISIFKVAGIGDYVKSSDIDKFFKSITFKTESNKKGWSAYSPVHGGYEISVPSNYTIVKPKDSNYQKERISANEGSEYYMFIRSTLNDFYYIEEDTFELSQLAKGFYESMDFELQKKEFGTHLSMPCIHISAKKKNSDALLHFMIVLKDQQYFLMACKTTKTEAPASFFSSLKFKDFKYDQMQTYTDTTLHYSVTTDYKEKEKSFIETLTGSMNSYYKVKKPMPYLSWSEEKTIESPATGETVGMNILKCNDLRMDRSLDDFWKTQTDHYRLNTSLAIKERKKFEKNGIQGLDLILRDTNSVKQIRTRMYVNNGLLYIVHATADTASGTSAWVNTFFDTFKPSDSIIGRSIFEDKVDEFLKDAASKDSATRKKVEALCYEVTYGDKHAPKLMKFISSPDFNNVSLTVKNSMIYKLGRLKDQGIVPFLKKEYPKYTDSASIQLSILSSLANQQTIEGNKAFLHALTSDSPLSNSEYEVQDVFNSFYDSLKIAGSLFPQLLDITKYPEYKASIYSLLSTLLDSSMISPQVYAVAKKDLLRQANDELKRQITTEENNKESNSESSWSEDDYTGNDAVSRAMADAMAAAKAAEMAARNENTAIPSNWLLRDYCNLLGPFYSEPTVKAFFDKAFKTKDPEFKVSLIKVLLVNKQIVPDSMIDNLAKDIKTRLAIYSSLKNIKQLDRMKPEYRTQNNLVKAMIFAEKKIPEDSIQFLTTKYIESKTKKGYVYFYKSTNKDGSRVNLNFVAYQPKDSTAFVIYPEVNTSKTVFTNDDINKMMDEVCYELTLTGRKRVKHSNWNYDYSDYYGGEE
jgi:uncharacterized protein YbaP (TraB family)